MRCKKNGDALPPAHDADVALSQRALRHPGKALTCRFASGGMFPHPTLWPWLYGNHDPNYSLDHSRANFAAFQAGGKGSCFELEVPGGTGTE